MSTRIDWPCTTSPRQLWQSTILGVLIIGTLTACGGPPTWVTKGSAAFDGEGKGFYGVGSVIGVRNEPLAWDAAENRSRAELARQFQTYTAYLMRDYAASTSAADFTATTEEQHVERAVKTFVAVTLNGVHPVDRYKDEDDHSYYVLTKLSLDDMQSTLEKAAELDSEVRDFVRKNAERLFDELEKEENKRAGQDEP